MDMELGNINILFGNVVSVDDEQHRYRCRVSINGYTDMLEDDEVPYYFPWYGINYLPQVDDVVPVIIFDGVIWSGFYGKAIGQTSNLEGDDYIHYLEIFKRQVGNDFVNLTYKPSTGIEFSNADAGINIQTKKLELFCASQSIIIDGDGIQLGEGAEKHVPYGEDMIDLMKEMCDLIAQMASTFGPTFYTALMAAASAGVPFTAGFTAVANMIGTPGTGLAMIAANAKTLKTQLDAKMICSQTVRVK